LVRLRRDVNSGAIVGERVDSANELGFEMHSMDLVGRAVPKSIKES
jgi:hypothetical protein